MDTSERGTRVVVGVDGSPASYEALRWAVRHARLIGAAVDAVAAYELPGAVGWSARATDATFDGEQAARSLADEIQAVLVRADDVPVREHVVRGNPAEVLTEASAGPSSWSWAAGAGAASRACSSVRSASSAPCTRPARS